MEDELLMKELEKIENGEQPTPQEDGKEDPKSPEEPTKTVKEGADNDSEEPETPDKESGESDEELDKPLGEILGTKKEEEDEPEEDEPSQEGVVPLSLFLELKREMKELKEKTAASNDDVIADLSSRYDVDPQFMQEMVDAISSKTAKQFQDKYEPLIEKQVKEREQEKVESVFDKVFDKAVKQFSGNESIIQKDLIKRLALDPENADKSVKQLIEWAYGGALETVEGKPSVSFEKPKAGGGKKSTTLDFANLSPEDHKTIADDPKLRAEYGEWVTQNVRW